MTVILITQDVGLCSHEVATAIATCLDLNLVSQEQLELLVARRMQIRQSILHRLVAGEASAFERWLVRRHRLAEYTEAEIVALAARGNLVIECWGASGPLRAIKHVVSVHVSGGRSDVGPEMAHVHTPRWISRSVSSLSFTPRWPAGQGRECSEPFDICFDTARDSLAECLEHVRRLAQGPKFQVTAASRAMLARLVQEVHGRPYRGTDLPDRTTLRVLEVEVGSERIPLVGVASSEQAIARIEEHLHGKGLSTAARHTSSLPPGICSL